jgi:hypothetical protein
MGYKLVIICLLLIGLAVFGLYTPIKNRLDTHMYNINGIEISSDNFKTLFDAVPEGDWQLCSIEQQKCVPMKKVALT